MEHWLDLLLPLGILVGMATGFNSGFLSQCRWIIGLLAGTVLGIWFSTPLFAFADRLQTADPDFGHGVIFVVMLVISVAIVNFVLSTLIRGILPVGAEHDEIAFPSRFLGAILGIVKGILIVTLCMLAVHLILSGGLKTTWAYGQSLWAGIETSVSGVVLTRVSEMLAQYLSRFMPGGQTPPIFNLG